MSRLRISIDRRTGVRAAWILAVLAAAGIGWGVGQLGREPAGEPLAVPVEVAESVPAGQAQEAPVEPVPSPARKEQPAPPPPRPEPEPPPAPAADPAPFVPDEPPEQPVAEQIGSLVRAIRASELAEGGNADAAKLEASALLAEHPSYSELVDALLEDGSGEVQAWLAALRVVQLAGHGSIARDVARELKRSYSSTEQVAESIREWRILNPHILSVESSIAEERYVVVIGTVQNPDLIDIRRVRVLVEALDAGGNVLDTTVARVRPRLLRSGDSAEFKVSFKSIDATTVLRTRASIVEWESEVPGSG